MTDEATEEDYLALAKIIDRHVEGIMLEAAMLGAPPAISMRATILQTAMGMAETYGKAAVAAHLVAVAQAVSEDKPPRTLDETGSELDRIEAQLSRTMRDTAGRA